MRQSALFTKTRREAPKDEEAVNARLLIRAGYVDKVLAGVYSFLPLGFRVFQKIEAIIRQSMEEIGGVELLLPALQPKANWELTDRFKTYDALFKFVSYYSKQDFVLGPTHEEIISPLMKRFILSYKDLPRAVFQIQTKFRDEARVKSGLLRGREFVMKDLYSFHADTADLDQYYEKVMNAYKKIFDRVGIGEKTHLTFASGGSFSKYSHEFQTLTSAGEDEIYLCKQCAVAINKEIIKDQIVCPECKGGDLKKEKAVEVGNIFKLHTKYSDPFSLTYRSRAGKEQKVYMGCYGIGLNRLIGTIVELSHDTRGIIWPEAVAPFKIHLIRLGDSATIMKLGEKVYADFSGESREDDRQGSYAAVLYDDRNDASSGEKLIDADLIGIPWRAVLSEKTKGKIELKRRNENETKLVDAKELMRILRASDTN